MTVVGVIHGVLPLVAVEAAAAAVAVVVAVVPLIDVVIYFL